MNAFTRFLGIAMLAIAVPLFATSASAAEVRHPGAAALTLNGQASPATGLFAQSLPEGEKIVVAGRRGRVGAAIVGGIIAGALIAGAARAHNRRGGHVDYYYHRDRYDNRCERWLYKCDYGNRRACRKFYRHCE